MRERGGEEAVSCGFVMGEQKANVFCFRKHCGSPAPGVGRGVFHVSLRCDMMT
jgi:hypothetical protein